MTDLAPDDPRHGTANGYRNHGCRCGPCRDAAAEDFQQRWTAQTPPPPGDERHGLRATYLFRHCRCQRCREANTSYARQWRAHRRGHQRSTTP